MLKNGCYAFLLFNHINLQNRTETVNGCIDSIIDTMQVRYARHTPFWNTGSINDMTCSIFGALHRVPSLMALVGHPGMDWCNYGIHRLRGNMLKKIMAPLGHVIGVP